MAETPLQPSEEPVSDSDLLQYWCYHCEKRVSIETLANLPDLICQECKNGFVESIPSPSPPLSAPPSGSPDQVDDPAFGSQFLQMLRLIAQSARDDDAPPPPPQNHSSMDDFLRIELDGWDNDEDDDDGVEFHNGVEENEADEEEEQQQEDRQDNEDQQVDEEDIRRRRRDVLRLRIRDLATRTRSGRNRILDWAEILMGLEDHAIEFRLQGLESDRYVGNPEDYVDGAEYETLLQTLAERDGSGRRGAPPAAKSVVLALPSVEIMSEDNTLACAVCKDIMNVGEIAKKLPCGHLYHGDCIVPWLSSRNSCPVCRFELPTDDPEYEDEKKKKMVTATGASGSGGAYSVSD
ncbi:E3 ubiquitin-protein ligase RING1 [Quillaja saponaria]|uniref:RING-type E3 ubiquitin transferase n=1 Tax=Quillaja saponaria TaxID=32244 RepID=A0AAD7KPP5_QUISA|nr:E3 ubiquitin-protein ligase RING1 [Quillaja saponaria]